MWRSMFPVHGQVKRDQASQGESDWFGHKEGWSSAASDADPRGTGNTTGAARNSRGPQRHQAPAVGRSPLAARLATPPGPGKGSTGNHGTATAIFKKAIERGNLVVVEVTALEIGRLDLADALELMVLTALKDRPRSRRLAARWLDAMAV